MMPRYVKTHPSFSAVRTMVKKEPERLWQDRQGRLFGQYESWFVHLPTQKFETFDEEEILLPEPDDVLDLINLAYIDKPTKEQKKMRVQIVDYPERIDGNPKTCTVNLNVLWTIEPDEKAES